MKSTIGNIFFEWLHWIIVLHHAESVGGEAISSLVRVHVRASKYFGLGSFEIFEVAVLMTQDDNEVLQHDQSHPKSCAKVLLRFAIDSGFAQYWITIPQKF